MKRIVRIFICLIALLAVSTSVAEGRGFKIFRKVNQPKSSFNMQIPRVSIGSRINTHPVTVLGYEAIKAKQNIDRGKINPQLGIIELQVPVKPLQLFQPHTELKFEPTKKE